MRDVSKVFARSGQPRQTLFHHLRTRATSGPAAPPRAALSGVSLRLEAGERVGVIGHNGSGKTTLMRLVTGVYAPSSGHVEVRGRVIPVLQLGLGVIGRLTVRSNIFLYGAIMGLSRADVRARFQEILEFAELEDFADTEVRHLSSGMQQRLTFSTAMQAAGDLMLLDEVLAVGDIHFRERCYSYFEDRFPASRAMLFCSHSLEEVERFCSRTVWLEGGRVMADADTPSVIQAYRDRPR